MEDVTQWPSSFGGQTGGAARCRERSPRSHLVPATTVDHAVKRKGDDGNERAVRLRARMVVELIDRSVDGLGARLAGAHLVACPQISVDEADSNQFKRTLSTTEGVCR